MKYLGLDLGTKTLGLSISDSTETIASPLKTIRYKNEEQLVSELAEVIIDKQINKIVLGLPLNMNGSEGESAKRTRIFADNILKTLGIDIDFQDERLSTKEAESIMISSDLSRKKRKTKIDKMAAVIILQNYLDIKKGKENGN